MKRAPHSGSGSEEDEDDNEGSRVGDEVQMTTSIVNHMEKMVPYTTLFGHPISHTSKSTSVGIRKIAGVEQGKLHEEEDELED